MESKTPLADRGIGSITAETVLESMTDGFYLLDEYMKFDYINEIAENAIGMRRSEILGKSVREVFPDCRGAILKNSINASFKRKPVKSLMNIWGFLMPGSILR
ncbi:hypothetical protein BB776_04740 [Planococcus salinarum]|uniref:PAS domain-containing protein n=1 Tax=Planococcus salinarum TaxID=622695 RepID=A0ABX3CTB4_9BACL|nr:hypothetical protein BB776_04740 [Planococcus salinarum]